MRNQTTALLLTGLVAAVASTPVAIAEASKPARAQIPLAARGAHGPPGSVIRAHRAPPPIASNPGLDVQHYHFDLAIVPQTRGISGTVTISVKATSQGVDEMVVDMANNLDLLEVAVDGAPAVASREPNRAVIAFASPPALDAEIDVELTYAGTPEYFSAWPDTGLAFEETETGDPWIYSLNEPFGARTWTPVIEDVADKATWSLAATVPTGLVVASNGTRNQEPEPNGDGTVTHHWATQYPNAIYLFSVAIAPYVVHESTYTRLDGGAMPIDDYILPEYEGETIEYLSPTAAMLRFLAETFGEYPFADEKYGHAMLPGSPGMEHATMTSLGQNLTNFDRESMTVLHEAAHQWFGDWVTMERWEDIWLNESFATYCEALWAEHEKENALRYYGRFLGSVRYDGTVIAEDESAPFDDSASIYDRGARVLHMLRHLVGDEVFFPAIRDYLVRFGGGSATTDDLREILEEAYAEELTWFFDQWIYQPSRPWLVTWHRPYQTEEGAPRVEVRIKQVQSHHIYRLPVDLELLTESGDRIRPERQWTSTEGDLTVLDLAVPEEIVEAGVDPDGVLFVYESRLGAVDIDDIPKVRIEASRRSSVGELTTELTAVAVGEEGEDGEIDEDFIVHWFHNDAASTTATGPTTIATYPWDEEYEYGFAWHVPQVALESQSTGAFVTYPALELRAYHPEYYTSMAQGDLNRDAYINGVDLALAAASLGAIDDRATLALSGDVDQDGDIDSVDMEILSGRMGMNDASD